MSPRKRTTSTQTTILACTVCMQRNYTTTRSGRLKAEQSRLELNKFCPNCQAHTQHKETK